MLVYGSVVHQDDDLLGLGFFVYSELLQRPVKKVIEDNMIGASFRYLS